MPLLSKRAFTILRNPLPFIWQVLGSFRANQGLLLSGAVAYYTLLSIIPLFFLILVGLSQFTDDQALLTILEENLELLVPGQSATITALVTDFLDHREVISWVGMLVVLFFSSMTFTVLENAMSVIFFHRVSIKRRHFLVSAVIPYFFIILLGMGLLIITAITGAIQTIGDQQISFMTWQVQVDRLTGTLLYLLGLTGLVVMFTAIYLVMPVGHLSVRHALVGSITATILWEVTRRILVWYFSKLSLVNVVYGSLGATIVVLVSLEMGALIILLGAQTIAEYERFGEPSPALSHHGMET